MYIYVYICKIRVDFYGKETNKTLSLKIKNMKIKSKKSPRKWSENMKRYKI